MAKLLLLPSVYTGGDGLDSAANHIHEGNQCQLIYEEGRLKMISRGLIILLAT